LLSKGSRRANYKMNGIASKRIKIVAIVDMKKSMRQRRCFRPRTVRLRPGRFALDGWP